VKAKITGLIGAGLLALSFIPAVSVLFTILGLVLVGAGVYMLDSENAFNKFLLAGLFLFIANMLYYFKIVAVITTLMIALFHSTAGGPALFSMDLIFGIGAYFLVYYVLQIVSSVYMKNSFEMIAKRYDNRFMHLSGYFLVAGSVLNIFLIGMLVTIAGWVLVMLGFFTIEDIIDVEIIEEEKKLLEKKD